MEENKNEVMENENLETVKEEPYYPAEMSDSDYDIEDANAFESMDKGALVKFGVVALAIGGAAYGIHKFAKWCKKKKSNKSANVDAETEFDEDDDVIDGDFEEVKEEEPEQEKPKTEENEKKSDKKEKTKKQ